MSIAAVDKGMFIRPIAAAAVLAIAASAGCMQLETRIRLNEDCSATITERLRFSRMLLDQAGAGEADLLKLLSREGALERMKRMGKGISLVKHELREAEGGSKESFAEFRIEDINDLLYCSPWPFFVDYPQNNTIACKLEPMYKNGSSGGQWWAGTVRVRFMLLKRPRGADDGLDPKAPPPKGPAPVELQIYRELGPVFRDMMKDFRVRLTFESYCPILPLGGSPGIRNLRARTVEADILDFSSENLDNWGGRFLENEEIMLEIARWRLAGSNIAAHTQNYPNNPTLPVYIPRSRSDLFDGVYFYVTPSRPLFDRYFQGKELDYRPWGKEPPAPADFNRIGWKKSEGAREKKERDKEPGKESDKK
jgi:hypothetical protein